MATLAFDRSVKEMRVQDPDTSAEVVEVYSQSRDYEALLTNMDLPSLVQAAGKEPLGQVLGANVFVGITMVLTDNWLVGWQDQAGPSTVVREIRGGNTLGQVEPQGEPNPTLQVPVAPTTFATVVITQSSSATLLEPSLQADLHGQVERSVYVDTAAVSNGNGYQQTPFNNWTDAADYAENNNIRRIVLLNDATLDRQMRNFTFIGQGHPVLDCNGQDVNRSDFQSLELDGTMVAANNVNVEHCSIRANFAGIKGHLHRCGLQGKMTLAQDAELIMEHCYSEIAGLSRPEIDMNAASTTAALSVRNFSGGLTLSNSQAAGNNATIEMSQGKTELAASNTAGTISVRGVAHLVDNSAGATVDIEALADPQYLIDMWQLLGLDRDNPLTVTKTSQVAGGVNQTIGGDGENTSTVTRNP